MMIIWWSKHVGVILNVLVCYIWINVLIQTSALVGPLYIISMATLLLTYLFTYLHSYLITYLLSYSMQQNPSWESNQFSESQEIPRVLWNPKVYQNIRMRPPPVSILSQLDPVHMATLLTKRMFRNYNSSLLRHQSANQSFFSICSYVDKVRPSGESLRILRPSCGLKFASPCLTYIQYRQCTFAYSRECSWPSQRG
jgi:hypothetical protein